MAWVAQGRICPAHMTVYIIKMPYEWSPHKQDAPTWELSLWPYRSLLKRDFVLFFGATALVVSLPMIVLVGSFVIWGILPFFLIMLWALWAALQHSYKSGTVLETFTATNETVTLVRRNHKGPDQTWQANRYWAQVHLHPKGGPVENYLTLRGGDREVEIGAFLDVSERLKLYGELRQALRSDHTE